MDPQPPQSVPPQSPAPVPPAPGAGPDPTLAPAPMAAAAQSVLPNVPNPWPGAWGAYKYSKQAVQRNWGAILGLALISIFLSGVPAVFLGKAGRPIGELLSTISYIALITAYLASVRGQKISFGAALKTGLDPMTFLKCVGALLVIGLGLGFLFILLIVPGVIVLPRIILAPYFLIDRKLGPLEAINVSWEATKGHSGKVWGTIGATVAIALLALTIIGIPFAFYFLFMYGAVQALLYEFISRTQPAAAALGAVAGQAQPPTPQAPVPPMQQ